MIKKDFNNWLGTMKDSIATWSYYTNFKKTYRNVDKIKPELDILNTLVRTQNIEEEFKKIVKKHPSVLKAIPILLAIRQQKISILDIDEHYIFDFQNMNYSIDDYCLFMRKTELFDLLQNHIFGNLYDYVLGIEVGMDTNGRKNRTGDVMEDIVESYLIKTGLIKNETYFKEMTAKEIEKKFNLDLSSIGDNKTNKRFDFVFVGPDGVFFGCECNFYSGGGSKLSETARSYKKLGDEIQNIEGFKFIWITDGKGWDSAKHNLEETYDSLELVFNIQDLENKNIDILVDPSSFLKSK